jgi:hypothetical protein
MKAYIVGALMIVAGIGSFLEARTKDLRCAARHEIAALSGGACAGKGMQSAGCDPANETCTTADSVTWTHKKWTGQMEAVCQTTGSNKTCGTCGTPMLCILTETGCTKDANGNCQNCTSSNPSNTNTDCVVSGTCTM